jgi:tetratricopeptide (TPR) repeat protein
MSFRLLFLFLAVVGVLGLIGWLIWPTKPPTLPPEIALDHAEPAVAAVVEKARADVLREPHSAEAWGKLGMVLSSNNFNAPALECFAQAERLDPLDPRWPYIRGNSLFESEPKEGIALLEKALKAAKSQDDRATIHFRLARMLIENGQLDEAASHVQGEQQIEGESPRVVFCRALLARARDEVATAREQLKKLLGVPFVRKKACILLSNLFQQDPQQARLFETQAAGLPEDVPWPDNILDPIENYRVLRFGLLTQVQKFNSQRQFHQALALARQLVEESPDVHSYFILAETLEELKQYQEAERCYQKVIELDPQHVSALYSRGSMLLERGLQPKKDPARQTEARELFQQAVSVEDRAIAIQHDHAGAYLVRGRALSYLGKKEEAIKSLREAVLCRPEVSDIHLYLGEALAEAGHLDEAVQVLQNAVRLAQPNDIRPREALKKWQEKAKG